MVILQIMKRNFMLFVRDKSAVFFSLLSMMIVVALMGIFLGSINIESIQEILNAYGGVRDINKDRENAEHLVLMWTIAGILLVNSVTVCQTVIGLLVEDNAQGRLISFYVAPVKRLQLALGYILASVAVSTLICILTLVLAEGYVILTGGTIVGVEEHIKLLGMILLNSCVFSSIMYLLAVWVKSTGAWSGLATIVGTLAGFVSAVYLPMGSLPESVGNVLKHLPFLHSASVIRRLLTGPALDQTFTGLDIQILDEYKEAMGITVAMNGKSITTWQQLLFLMGCGIIAIGIAAVCMRYKKAYDR